MIYASLVTVKSYVPSVLFSVETGDFIFTFLSSKSNWFPNQYLTHIIFFKFPHLNLQWKNNLHLKDLTLGNRITTLGSETSGGSVYILDLSDSLFNTRFPIRRRLNKISLFNCTIWTADGNFDGDQAAIGKFRPFL